MSFQISIYYYVLSWIQTFSDTDYPEIVGMVNMFEGRVLYSKSKHLEVLTFQDEGNKKYWFKTLRKLSLVLITSKIKICKLLNVFNHPDEKKHISFWKRQDRSQKYAII